LANRRFIARLHGDIDSLILSGVDAVVNPAYHKIHESLQHVWEIEEFQEIINSNSYFLRKPSELLRKQLQNYLKSIS